MSNSTPETQSPHGDRKIKDDRRTKHVEDLTDEDIRTAIDEVLREMKTPKANAARE